MYLQEYVMLIREMNSKACRELLARLGTGRLACARNSQPYVVPIDFAYEADHLYGFSTVGQKIEWMRENPLVCVEAGEVGAHNQWATVVALGRYEELPDNPEYAEARRRAQSVLERRSLWWQTGYAASQLRGGPKPAEPVFYCIHIEEISGHRAAPDEIETFLSERQRTANAR
jgi:uncharacterized protein